MQWSHEQAEPEEQWQTNSTGMDIRSDGYNCKEVQQTCIQHGMFRQGNPGRFGKETRHGDSFWLEPLIQSIQGVCVDAVCYSELRNLQ